MPKSRNWKRERSLESEAYKESRRKRKRDRYHFFVALAKKVGVAEAKRQMAGKDLDHVKPLAQGGGKKVRLRSKSANRSDKGTIFKGKRTTRPRNPKKN